MTITFAVCMLYALIITIVSAGFPDTTPDIFDVGEGDRVAMTWWDANQSCIDQGKKLAWIRNDFELAEAAAICHKDNLDANCWIGLIDRETEGIWLYSDDTLSDKSYGFNPDGSAKISEGPWDDGFPQSYDCVELNRFTGKIRDKQCGKLRYPMCRAEDTISDLDYYGTPLLVDFGVYFPADCVISTHAVTDDFDIESCLSYCYNEALCTYIMFHDTAPTTCYSLYWCDEQAKHSDETESMIYKIHRINDVYQNKIESGQSLTDIGGVLYSPSRSYYMHISTDEFLEVTHVKYGNTRTIAGYENALRSELITEVTVGNNGDVTTTSTDELRLIFEETNILRSGDSNDTNGPFTLKLSDYGQLILQDAGDTIRNVFYYGEETLNPNNDDHAYARSCAPFSSLQTVNGGVTAEDGVWLGLDMAANLASAYPYSASGRYAFIVASSFYKIGSGSFKFAKKAETESVYYDIFKCVQEYVEYELTVLRDDIAATTVSTFETLVEEVFSHLPDADNLDEQFQLFTGGGEVDSYPFPDLKLGIETFIDDYGTQRELLPEIAQLMNVRLFEWGVILSNYRMNCTSHVNQSQCISEWITANDACDEDDYQQAMESFRDENAYFMDEYYHRLPEVWNQIMNDTTISTQQKHEQLNSIWMDGVFCGYWLHATYQLSKKLNGKCCVDISGEDACYIFIDSYQFSADIDSFSSYGDGLFDFSASIFDCKVHLADQIAQEMDAVNELSWNPYEELYGESFGVIADQVKTGNSHRCFKESDASYSNAYMDCTLLSGMWPTFHFMMWDFHFISSLTVVSFSDEDDNKNDNHLSDNLHSALPLLQRFTSYTCLNEDVMRNSGEFVKSDDLKFFEKNEFEECYGENNDPVWTENTAICPDDHVATGIQYYRGCVSSQGKYQCFLWKIRLQCRSVDSDIWRVDDYIMSNGAGEEPRNKYDVTFDYQGWTSVIECPPYRAMYRIQINEDGGWKNKGSANDDPTHIKLNYDIGIKCSTVSRWTEQSELTPNSVGTNDHDKEFKRYKGYDEYKREYNKYDYEEYDKPISLYMVITMALGVIFGGWIVIVLYKIFYGVTYAPKLFFVQ